jgi:hypothetical protein
MVKSPVASTASRAASVMFRVDSIGGVGRGIDSPGEGFVSNLGLHRVMTTP